MKVKRCDGIACSTALLWLGVPLQHLTRVPLEMVCIYISNGNNLNQLKIANSN